MNKKTTLLVLLGILALGAFLRFWGLDWGLPYEYQTEEYKVIKYALRMGRGDFNPHFFEYPSLYLYFMLFLFGNYFLIGKLFGFFPTVHDFALQFVQDPTVFYLIGRSLESLFGLGIVILAYYIGKQIFSKRVGLLSSFALSVLPYSVNKSHMTKGDLAAIFLGLLVWFFSYKIYKTGKTKYYYIAAIVMGLTLSTKYYMGMMGIAIITAHCIRSNPFFNRHFILSLGLIPIFFIMGTPYSVLSPEFMDKMQSLFTMMDPSQWADPIFPFPIRLGKMMIRFFKMEDYGPEFMFGSFGFGFLGLLGGIRLFLQKKSEALLVFTPVLTYLIVVYNYVSPVAGYLAPIFPLWILSGMFFVDAFWPDPFKDWFKRENFNSLFFKKSTVFFIFILSAISSFGDSLIFSYRYGLPDTRTIAKEWIEAHLPNKSKILMDVLPSSPPLTMSRKQLDKFYKIALAANHYKKEYFQLKLEVVQPHDVQYTIFLLKRTVAEIMAPQDQVLAVQKTQDLITVNGDEKDWSKLKDYGIQYIITNNWAEEDAHHKIPRISQFYHNLEQRIPVLKTFVPETKYHPGPVIKIYKLSD